MTDSKKPRAPDDPGSMIRLGTSEPMPAGDAPEASSREVFFVDDGISRSLYFDNRYVQSQMVLDDPHALNLEYTRAMMGFLLFLPKPKHIVIIGLGGGSLTKFCHRSLPRTKVTTIEIDPRVIALAERFDVPPPDERLAIVEADAFEWFADEGPAHRRDLDIVMLDAYDREGIAAVFRDPRFYTNVRNRLRSGGLLVANIIDKPATVAAHKQLIADAFDGQVLSLHIASDDNHVVFAMNAAHFAPDWIEVARAAKALGARHGLDFASYARRLRRSHERRVLAGNC